MEHIEDSDTQGTDEGTRRCAWYRRPATIIGAAAGLVAVGALAIGVPIASAASEAESATSSAVVVPARPGTTTDSGDHGSSGRYGGYDATPNGTTSGTSATQTDATAATADESTGVALIDTTLGYQNGAGAGTGMVLTSDGLVLTNNHVVEGATEITVTIASTGETYTATVVGTDATDDVALLQLDGASGLATVTIDDDGDTEAVGDDITAVGNAEGGGLLLAADGEITDLESTVTTASEGTVSSETLDGMIEIQADVVAGDSGGAVLDSDGEVIGMTTAASSGTAVTTAYAIPIDDALALVQQMLAGDESGDVTLGYPAFLGIAIAQSTSSLQGMPDSGGFRGHDGTVTTADGVTIAGVYQGTPAADAGLTAGDTITAVDGTSVTDSSSLTAILSEHDPGDTVTMTWVDTAGATQSASVTLIAGPVA